MCEMRDRLRDMSIDEFYALSHDERHAAQMLALSYHVRCYCVACSYLTADDVARIESVEASY